MNGESPLAPLVLADLRAWHDWLLRNAGESDGIWLALAKKGITSPTSLSYQEALEEALCEGWIDGQVKTLDARLFVRRFTPRRRASIWSKRNVELVARLEVEGRLRAGGLAEIARAKSDGRWERAYAGAAAVEVPAELADALAANAPASAAFEALSRTERYSALHPLLIAPTPEVRTRRIAALIERLAATSASKAR